MRGPGVCVFVCRASECIPDPPPDYERSGYLVAGEAKDERGARTPLPTCNAQFLHASNSLNGQVSILPILMVDELHVRMVGIVQMRDNIESDNFSSN